MSNGTTYYGKMNGNSVSNRFGPHQKTLQIVWWRKQEPRNIWGRCPDHKHIQEKYATFHWHFITIRLMMENADLQHIGQIFLEIQKHASLHCTNEPRMPYTTAATQAIHISYALNASNPSPNSFHLRFLSWMFRKPRAFISVSEWIT